MSDEKKEPEIPETLEQRIDKLIFTKNGYERNRNLTGCVVALFGYYIYTGIRDGDGTWWFYLLMGAMFLVACYILWHSWRESDRLEKKINELKAEKKARDDAAAEAEAAEDTALIEGAATSADQASDADKAEGAAASADQASDADKAEGAAADESATDNQASDADKA